MMPEFDILVEKYLRDDLSPDELAFFLSAVKDPANLQQLRRIITQKLEQQTYTGFSAGKDLDLLFRQMLDSTAKAGQPGERGELQEPGIASPDADRRSVFAWSLFGRRSYRLGAAAAVLVLLGVGFFALFHPAAPPIISQLRPGPVPKNDPAPGGNKAILTLSDGSTIALNDASDGELAKQGNTRVLKLANGQLAYRADGKAKKEILYNTMSTPRGGQYMLLLPDGTRVWLNASSSITYPTAFVGKERVVSMVGEAYFEVTPRASMPFKVKTNGMEVEEIGTHFNINAYADEVSAKTSLLEGAVRIIKGSSSVLLKPGQQAGCGAGSGISVVDDADVEESVAWKNGLFSFNGADLPVIMRQLARWYDLDVRYEGLIAKRRFTGKVFRNLHLSEILKVLELNHVHFRMEGNKLTVMP